MATALRRRLARVCRPRLVRPRPRHRSHGPLPRQTGSIDRPLDEAIPLAARALPAAEFAAWKRGLTAELARLVRLLHGASYFHRDLYLCHFYVAGTDILSRPARWPGHVVVIDLHRLARRRLT